MRLWILFSCQIFLVAAALAIITSFLFVSMRSQIEGNVRTIVQNSLERYEASLLEPIYEMGNLTSRMKLEFEALNLSLSTCGATFSVASHKAFFATLRRTLWQNEFVAYSYSDLQTSFLDQAHGNTFYWDEITCSSYACYRVINNTAYWIDINSTDGYTVQNFTNASLSSTRTFQVSTGTEAYVTSIINIPRWKVDGSWSPTYIWRESNILYSLLCRDFCVEWDINGYCRFSYSTDLDLKKLTHYVAKQTTTQRSYASLIDFSQMKLISTTFDFALVDDASFTISVNSSMYNTNETSKRWSGLATPSEPLNRAVHQFLGACVATMTPATKLGVASINVVTYKCNSLVVLDSDYVFGMRAISLDNETDFLYVDITPRSELFGGIDSVLTSAIIVATTVAGVTTVVVSMMFFAFSRAITTLVTNFEKAASLQNEDIHMMGFGVTFVREMRILQQKFIEMNARLMQARAFLPQSLVLQQQGSSDSSLDFGDSGEAHTIAELSDEVEINAKSRKIAANPLAAVPVVAQDETVGTTVLPTGREIDHSAALSPSEAEITHRNKAVTFDVPQSSSSSASSGIDPDNPEATEPRAKKRILLMNDGAPVVFHMENEDEGEVKTHRRDSGRGTQNAHSRRTGLNFSEILTIRRVTVMFGNMIGFHELCRGRGPVEAQRLQGVVTQVLEEQAALARAVIDSFHGDHFMITLNASSSCMLHGVKCASFTLAVQSRLASLKDSAIRFDGIRFGIASGSAICGNYGSESLRRFSVIGPVVNEAFALMQHCKNEEVLNLITPASFSLMAPEYVIMHQNFVILPCRDQGEGSLISTILRHHHQRSSLGCPPWVEDANKAFEYVAGGLVESAIEAAARVPLDQCPTLRAMLAHVSSGSSDAKGPEQPRNNSQ